MKTYNPKAKCKKCGSKNKKIISNYKRKNTRLMEGFEDDPLGISYSDTREWTIMIRKCVRCGYSWYEIPLDAKGISATEGLYKQNRILGEYEKIEQASLKGKK